jgi:hypothetical protein
MLAGRGAWICRTCRRGERRRRPEDDGADDGRRTADYIVVGLGAAGSALVRALGDDPSASVLGLEWGPDRRGDPTATDLLRTADAAHDPGTALRVGGAVEPGLLGARCALAGGRAVGGSTLVDSALWGTGGPREWKDFARACSRAGPRSAGRAWSRRLASAASGPLARVETYEGPRDAPIGGAPSSALDSTTHRTSATLAAGDPFLFPGPAPRRVHHGGDGRTRAEEEDDEGSGLPGYDDDDDEVPDWPTRGVRGPVRVRALAPAWPGLAEAFVAAADRVYGVQEIADHNGPAPFGVSRRVQFAVGPGRHAHGFNRQAAGDAFVPRAAEREACARCRRRRRVEVEAGAHVVRVLFEQGRGHRRHQHDGAPRAVGVLYLEGGVRPVEARARKRVILCASAMTPALLQRSGVGDPRLLAGIGVDTVTPNPRVGCGYRCQYGFRMVASVGPTTGATRPTPDLRSDANPLGTVGIVMAQDPTRPRRRRRQWCVMAAAGPLPDFCPVAGDPLVRAASRWEPFGGSPARSLSPPLPSPPPPPLRHPHPAGPASGHGRGDDRTRRIRTSDAARQECDDDAAAARLLTVSAWLLDPASCDGAIESPSADPAVMPRARLGLFADGADMVSLRTLARSVVQLVDAMGVTPDGHAVALAHPTRDVIDDDALLDLWLRTEAFYVAHRHMGVCAVGPAPWARGASSSSSGVVDGWLRVHGVEGLSVCDSTVFGHGMGLGTAAGTAAILATAYGDMLLDGLVRDARDTTRERPHRRRQDRPRQSVRSPDADHDADDGNHRRHDDGRGNAHRRRRRHDRDDDNNDDGRIDDDPLRTRKDVRVVPVGGTRTRPTPHGRSRAPPGVSGRSSFAFVARDDRPPRATRHEADERTPPPAPRRRRPHR